MRISALQNSNASFLSGVREDEELRSISRETDPELFRESLFQYARRQEDEGHLGRAVGIYQRLREDGTSDIAARAGTRLEAIRGGGSFGPRAEFLLRRLVSEAADPGNLLAMGVAASVFRMTRLATLSRLTASPVSNALTRGFGARASASLAGFFLEAPAFTLASRLSHQAMGEEIEWNASALGRDLASSYLVLGAMKAVGSLGATAYQRSGAVSGFSRTLFGQAALFGGILLGHRLEVLAGIRPSGDGGGTLVDSLALLLQFNIAGRLSRHLGGEVFSNWENHLDSQAGILGSSKEFIPSLVSETPIFGPVFAMAGIGDRGHLNSSSSSQVISTTFPPSSWPAYESFHYPPGGNGPRPPRIRYRPEVRRLWEGLEPVLREVPFEATPEEILRRRADFEIADQLWLEQIRDFSELVGGHVEIHEPQRLREPWTSQFLKPREDLLTGAMAITEGKGRVYEISLPYGDARFGRPTEKGQYAGLQHILSELETSFGDQVLLANVQQGRLRIRLPNLPLWEALLMARFGNQVHRLVLVDGEIPRDDVMRLRGKLLAPVGMSRQPLFVGELKGRVHPFFFVLHDLFHATNVCMLPPQLSRTSHRLYFIAKRELPASDIKEEHLNRLADMDPGSDFRGNPGIFVDFSLRPFWDGIRKDVLSEDVAWRRFQRFPKFLNSYEKMLDSHPPENPEDSHWHEAFRLRVQEYKGDFSNLLRTVLRN